MSDENCKSPCDCSCEPLCGPALAPWQERMVEEYAQLKDRYCKLHRVITKIEAHTCDFNPACPLDLLKAQAAAMGEYLHILEIRAEIEKVPLPY